MVHAEGPKPACCTNHTISEKNLRIFATQTFLQAGTSIEILNEVSKHTQVFWSLHIFAQPPPEEEARWLAGHWLLGACSLQDCLGYVSHYAREPEHSE